MMNTGAPPVATLPCSAAFDSASFVKSLLLQQGGVGLSSVSDADQKAATSRSSACRTFSFDGDSFARAARQQRGRSSLATATHQPQLVYIKGPLNPEFRCTGRELRFLSNTWVTHKPTFHLIINLCQGCFFWRLAARSSMPCRAPLSPHLRFPARCTVHVLCLAYLVACTQSLSRHSPVTAWR